jgi:ABC-type multidrug transport system ATPase subunit
VTPGESFGLLGPNGAGKSTTMRMIGGTTLRTSGTLLVNGLDPEVRGPEVRANLGVVPQQDNLDVELRARDNLIMYGRYFGLPYSYLRPRADELLEFAQLTEKANEKVDNLSGGMKRRLTIARALVNEPRILLLDEPTTGLDPLGVRDMKDWIIKLREQGKTVLMCSHQLTDVQDVCDRVAILHQGELKELGRVDSLLKVGDETEFRTTNLSDAGKAEVKKVIEKYGASVLSVGNPTTTLEDLFLKIIRESEEHPGRRARESAAKN